jgi:hypothetical protein
MYNELIQNYLKIILKIEELNPNIGKHSTMSNSFSQWTILGDLRFNSTKEKLLSNELPDDVVMYRLAKIAEHHNF